MKSNNIVSERELATGAYHGIAPADSNSDTNSTIYHENSSVFSDEAGRYSEVLTELSSNEFLFNPSF
ncbi:MAG: hypothetical protein COB85_06140, partial [Bacteroidetes bacterium]